jgi:hypothetical protein
MLASLGRGAFTTLSITASTSASAIAEAERGSVAGFMDRLAVTHALTENRSTPDLTAIGLAQFSDVNRGDTHNPTATLQSTTTSGR